MGALYCLALASQIIKIAGQLPIADSAEKLGVDGGAAVPPLKKHVEFLVFGRVSGLADRGTEVFQQNRIYCANR